MADTTEATRTFVSNLFTNIAGERLGTKFLSALSDDIIWKATGSSPLAGVYRGKKSYQEDVLGKLHDKLEYLPGPQLDKILADGEWAAVYFHTTGARASSGMDFSMEYCWLMKVQHDKVVEVVGFYDQKKMVDLFAE